MPPASCASSTTTPSPRSSRRAARSCSRPAERTRSACADAVAPGLPDLGVFLPYSPLHHLLLAGVGRPLVMTSGNSSDEPIAHDDDDAATRLGPMVDGLLTHDRAIHIRCDDSVERATGRRLQLLRRSRGYAPEPMPLPFAVATRRARRRRRAEVDGRGHAWRRRRRQPSHRRPRAPRDVPVVPPGGRPPPRALRRASRRWSRTTSIRSTCRRSSPSTSTFRRWRCSTTTRTSPRAWWSTAAREPVLGLAFDGLGYGADGTLWGGEILVADFDGFERVGHLRPGPMPGGVAAIREPWRMAAVWAQLRRRRPARRSSATSTPRPSTRWSIWRCAATAPVTTSMGRLFDAVAALLGCRTRVTYEAQAAIELEAHARARSTASTRAATTTPSPSPAPAPSRTRSCSTPPRSSRA